MQFNDYRTLGFTSLQNGLIAYYPQLKISDAEFIIIVQLEAFAQRGEKFPANDKIAANTNLTSNEVASLIQRLIDQKLLTIQQSNDREGKIQDQYDLGPLYNKLDKFLSKNILVQDQHENKKAVVSDSLENNPLNKLARQFEIEFGRFLSPIEREEIASWLEVDHYTPEVITLALREAVLSQAYSLKYIDRILLNWQRHNLKTSAEIKRFLQRNR